MLVLSSTPHDGIVIAHRGVTIKVSINQIKHHAVSLGFDAPAEVKIYRESIFHRVMAEGARNPRLKRDIG